MVERPKIGELLVAAGVIDSAALESALEKQRAEGGRLGKILIAMHALDEEMLVRTVARQLEMPVAWLRGKQVKAEVLSQLPRHVALRHRCLPVMIDRKGPETLLVAMEDPSDAAALDEVAIAAGRPVRVVLAAPSELDDALARHYPSEPEPEPAEDEEPELLLTDSLGETRGGEPELRRLERAEPAAEPASADPLDLGGAFDPGARPADGADLGAREDFGASHERGADPGAVVGDGLGGSDDLGAGDDLGASAARESAADLDVGRAGAAAADLAAPDDLGLDIEPDPAVRAGDSLDDAIDAVRGADAAHEIGAPSGPGGEGVSLFGDDPLEATLSPAPARAAPARTAPARADAAHADALPRDAELRAVALLLIERGLLTREELAARLLALRADGDATGS